MKSIIRLAGQWLFIVAVVRCGGAEQLDRGLVAIPMDQERVYLGWRWLADDRPETGFWLQKASSSEGPWRTMNSQPIKDSCNYVDEQAGSQSSYYRVTVANAAQADIAKPVVVQSPGQRYLSIKLQGHYRAQKVGLADLDGDGRLDYIVKQPDFNTDPYQQPGYWKKSEDTYKIEAYRHDGSFLWRYDMGWSIEEGIWYSPMVVYDLDGDGRAEVCCKAGEGDPREATGHVRSGPEYLVVLDGLTGRVKKKLPWPSREGFDDYNYYSRNLLGLAYLDGIHPFLIMERGTYKIIKVQALASDFAQKWYWEASGEYQKYRGQGMHGMHAADVDEDGRDEVVLGSVVLDDDGKPLWSTGLGHPDACYVADADPSRPGLEIFYGIEPGGPSNKVCLVEAKTGKILWGCSERTVHVHGQAMVGDIIPDYPGMECYAGEAKGGTNYWLYTADGRRLSNQSLGELSPKAVFWLDGPTKVLVVNNRILKYPNQELGRLEGRIVAIADCLGDWREEIVTALDGEIRIYTTTTPAYSRRVCLMQDRLYRTDVAMQTMGYFYPPQLGGTPLTAAKR